MFLPAGSRDETGFAVSRRYFVNEVFSGLAAIRGFRDLSTPVVEYADTFTNKHVGMKLQDMLKWFNEEGEIEVLRPDWTVAIARALANQEAKPQKWAYQGSIFKRNRPGVEDHQAGVELIHYPGILGESECLFLAAELLEKLGIPAFTIELGHTEIFETLASRLKLTGEQAGRLRQAMHDKRQDEVYEIAKRHGDERTAKELAALVQAFGSADIIEEYEQRWQGEKEILKSLAEVKRLHSALKDSGAGDVLVDLGRVKNLPYYSGMMFRGFLNETGEICFSGGRYDQLYQQYGKEVSAVGLAFDVEVLSGQANMDGKRKRICLLAEEASLSFAEKARPEFGNAVVDVLYRGMDTSGYDEVYELKEENGKYKVVSR